MPIRIVIAGGLVGQFDGMPEYPTAIWDKEYGTDLHPFGGLDGLAEWLKIRKATQPYDLFLMTANNLPRNVMDKAPRVDHGTIADYYLDRMKELEPSAIGVGAEDFFRGLNDRSRAAATVQIGQGLPPGTPDQPGEVPRPGPHSKDAAVDKPEAKGTPGLLVSWLRRPDLPFVLSNAAVRLRHDPTKGGPPLNTVSSNGFKLLIDENTSLGWVPRLSVEYPCQQLADLKPADIETRVRATLTGQTSPGASDADAPVTQTAEIKLSGNSRRGVCNMGLTFPSSLQPGAEYRLEVRLDDHPAAAFDFRTDESLTGRTAIAPPRRELPIIVALVDPNIKNTLAPAKWKWSNADVEKDSSGRAECKADECEILLLKPTDAFDAALSLVDGRNLADTTLAQRPVALLSQLSDADTTAILQHSARVRLLVWPPDSLALGVAAPRFEAARSGGAAGSRGQSAPAPPLQGRMSASYSGDLGYGAVLNSNTPAATQVWSRPEWFAEFAHEVSFQVVPVDRQPWEFTNVTHAAWSVKGSALCAGPPSLPITAEATGTATAVPAAVNYFVQRWDWDPSKHLAVFPDGPSAGPYAMAPELYAETMGVDRDTYGHFKPGAPGTPSLWTDSKSFAAVALDAMRNGLHTDIAVLPLDVIDPFWMDYLKNDRRAPTQWLSKVLLERLVFHAGTIVKVRVAGTALQDVISKVSGGGRSGGAASCLSGLGNTTCGNAGGSGSRGAGRGDMLVNGRRLDKNRFYTIALPEDVALDSGLARYGGVEDEYDLVWLMDQVLPRQMLPPRGAGSVGTCSAAEPDRVPPPREPADQPNRTGRPANQANAAPALPQQLEGMRASQNSPYVIIKPLEFSFNQTQVSQPPGSEGLFRSLPSGGAKPSRRISANVSIDAGIIDKPRWALRALGTAAYGHALVNGQFSTDPNASLVALRADWKALRGRIFGGYFWESQFGDQIAYITATSKGATGPTLPLVTLGRDYRYVAGGFELEKPQLTKWLSFDPLRITAAIGTSAHEHTDVQIGGQSQGLAAFQQLGATGLLNRYFASHPGLPATTPYVFVDQSLTRARMQIDFTPKVTVPFAGKKLDITFAGSYRRFVGPNAMPLTEHQSGTMKVTVAVPLYGLTTLNLNGIWSRGQVNGVSGSLTVWQPSVTVSVPIIGSRHAGWVF